MKQLFILFSFLFLSAFCYAQSYNGDVVYLKNGSAIRGVIIEQVPNQSLKIKTADGSIFVYNISDVEKIAKEELEAIEPATKSVYSNVGKKSLKGYKAFIDLGYTFADESREDANRFEASFSNGYRFNNYVFLGAGIAYHDYDAAKLHTVPIFVDFRANFINYRVTPFFDFRSGYSFGDLEGIYSYAGFGVRFGSPQKGACNLSLGYSYQEFEDYYESYYEKETVYTGGFTLKFGIEF
jgi:hypothetical protein